MIFDMRSFMLNGSDMNFSPLRPTGSFERDKSGERGRWALHHTSTVLEPEAVWHEALGHMGLYCLLVAIYQKAATLKLNYGSYLFSCHFRWQSDSVKTYFTMNSPFMLVLYAVFHIWPGWLLKSDIWGHKGPSQLLALVVIGQASLNSTDRVIYVLAYRAWV